MLLAPTVLAPLQRLVGRRLMALCLAVGLLVPQARATWSVVVINKLTGEINRLRDDGINYLQDLLVIPPDKVKEVATALNEGISGQDFGWQGR